MSWKKLLMVLPILAFGVATDARAATYDCWQVELGRQVNRGNPAALFLTPEDYNYSTDALHKGKALACGHKLGDVLGIGGSNGTNGCYSDAKVVIDGPHKWQDRDLGGRHVYVCDREGFMSNTWKDNYSELSRFGNCADADNFKKGDKYEEFFTENDRIYYCIYSRFKRSGNSRACIAKYNGAFCYMTRNQSNCYAKKLGYDRQNDTCTCKNKNEIYRDGKCITDPAIVQQKCADLGKHMDGGVCKCDDRDYFDPDVKQCLPKSSCNKSAVVCANNIINLDNIGNTTTTVNGGNASAEGGSSSANATNTNTNENHNNSDNTTVNGGDNGASNGGNAAANCRASRSTPEGRACCSLPNSVAKYNSSTKGCDCVDSSKVFKVYPGEVGRCVSKSGSGSGNGGGNGGAGEPVAVTPCDCAAAVKIAAEAKTSCAASSQVVLTAIMTINAKCPAGQPGASCDADELSAYVEGITSMIAGCSVEPVKPAIDSERLANAIANLDKYRSALDVSVWKDKEGNFNTSRLVSDSIAGVVLGTAGGLITSSVVKKNQIKSGFEDVVCTVGGQEVGSYGDEITVGIQ